MERCAPCMVACLPGWLDHCLGPVANDDGVIHALLHFSTKRSNTCAPTQQLSVSTA